MRTNTYCSLAAIAAALVFQPLVSATAIAQDQEPTTPEGPDPALSEDDMNTIIVNGARLIGRVDAPQPPILELNEDDIAAYGVGSIAELLQQLGPEITSGRGRGGGGGQPVILVNGIRVGSFRELASYPPEAIERFEVFTEEVAQRFGYSADQRVVNIILKDNYQSFEVEGEYSQPWAGGFSEQEVQGTYLRIDGTARLNFNAEWNNTTPLTEAERGVVQTTSSAPLVAGDPDPAAFRSLVGESTGYELTANWNNAISDTGTVLSLNATYERDDSLRLQGLDSVLLTGPAPDNETRFRSFNAIDPLAVDRRTDSYSTAATLNTNLGDWQVTGTVDATLADARTQTQARIDTTALVTAAAAGTLDLEADLGMFPDAGFDQADSQTYTVNALATARGNPLYIPGGDVSATLVAGYRANGIDSTDTRNPGFDTDLSRSRYQAGLNLGIPITSRDEDFGGALGDISLNLNGNVYEQSDFGTFTDWSAGITWGIFGDITLSATYLERETSPSLTQLGTPTIETPNVPVFDFANNETVLATVRTGGNADLLVQRETDWKFGIQWSLPFVDRGSLQIEYFDNSSRNVSSGFPVLTPEIEAAFPDRVERDVSGTLTLLDERFVSFARQDAQRIRVGLNMGGQFGGGDGQGGGQGGPPGGAPAGGPPPGAGQGGAPGAGQGAGRPNAEQFAAMRQRFCEADPADLVTQFNAVLEAQQNGTEPPLDEQGNPITIPPQMLQRLVGEDGRISADRITMARQFICTTDGAQPAAGGRPGGGQQAGAGGGRPGGGGGRGGFGRGGFPFGGNNDGPPVARWFANLNYTYEIDNTVLIAPGLPELDLLAGDALSGGGQPRHSAQWRSGIFYDGYGMFLTANYTGESEIRGSGQAGSTDLFFDDFATLDIRTFFDLGQRDSWVEAVPFLRNVRVGFDIENIFDSRQRVLDSNGDTPLRYQPFLLDPRGRSFELEFRKLF
ncbi:TonB-dependent receptor plug domain-containing protein [Erythrobacter sp. EC-HK427]|uniref:TonB-dependent receptor plug domain-containing protein n=1 Tax=Erythrobacter sp. EC-HK427 TaxID=2038396 RepID=UPI0018FECDEE|nr:TonB-dependent receptor plug domain-containing protein [Erythrobacter sp. EC-HK427]